MKKEHKIRYSLIAIAIVIIFISLFMWNKSDNALDFCVFSNNGDQLCFTQAGFNDFSVVASNSAGKSSVAPNEVTYVKIYTETPRTFVPPIYTAQVLLKDSSNKVINIWDVKSAISKQSNIASCISGFGSCASISVTGNPSQVISFNAPSTPGTYRIQYVLKDSQDGGKGTSILVDESTSFVVVSPTATTCPKNTCQSWTTTQSIENGVYQQRSCIVFDSSCSGRTSYEYRTNCDSGYLFGKTSNNQGSGYGVCNVEPVVEEQLNQPEEVVDTSMTDDTQTTQSSNNETVETKPNTSVPKESFIDKISLFFANLWEWFVNFFTVS